MKNKQSHCQEKAKSKSKSQSKGKIKREGNEAVETDAFVNGYKTDESNDDDDNESSSSASGSSYEIDGLSSMSISEFEDIENGFSPTQIKNCVNKTLKQKGREEEKRVQLQQEYKQQKQQEKNRITEEGNINSKVVMANNAANKFETGELESEEFVFEMETTKQRVK